MRRARLLRTAMTLALAVQPSAGEGQRLWLGEVELRGPLAEARFDCGEGGALHLEAGLLAGEERRLVLPFPVRSPLGTAGLAALPVPRATVPQSAGGVSAAGVRWVGWSSAQPEDRLARYPLVLRARSRAPSEARSSAVGAAELTLLGAALLSVLALRRRPRAALAAGGIAGAGLAAIASMRPPGSEIVRVLEVDANAGRAFERLAADEELELGTWGEAPAPGLGLEVQPEGAALRVELRPGAGGYGARVRARGARLWLTRPAEVPGLAVGANAWAALDPCWTRDAAGGWERHRAWSVGEPLPARLSGGGEDAGPPGWLAAGLPPGRSVLVGRAVRSGDAGTWVRVVGFPLRGP